MKKYFYLFGAIGTTLFGTSCKKDFTCKCTNTNSLSSDASVYEFTILEASKKNAKAACVSTENETTTYTYTGGNWTQVPVTYTSDCELK